MTTHSLVHEEAAKMPRRGVRQLVRLGLPQFLFLGGILGLLALVTAVIYAASVWR